MATTHPPTTAGDYARFCAGVKQLCGIDLDAYRPGQMERRLRTHAEREGHRDLDGYLAALRRDPVARDGFLDRMTINVSELFRNPERFEELERVHLPSLLRGPAPGLRVWSAGCSYGAEPYTLAMMLADLAPRGRHEILATDIDEKVLARAREGRFSEADLRNVGADRRRRHIADEATGGRADAALRRAITFRRLDLLADRYPDRLDLILCRNVVIYFTDAAKERIYAGFLRALRPGGILFVGSTERVNRAEEMGWERLGTFFYRRPA